MLVAFLYPLLAVLVVWGVFLPPRGYANLTVHIETRKRLEQLMREKGLSTLNDTVVLLLEAYDKYGKLEEKLQTVEERLSELEATCRKTYLALLRILEELTGRSGEGPESPAGGAVKEGREDESAPRRTVTRPLDADRSAPEPLRRGREPQTQHIDHAPR